MKFKRSNLIWGILLLLVAALLLLNQFGYFSGIGISSIVIAALAAAIFVQFIVHFHFAPLPIPLAILYIVLQKPLELPYIQIWALITASVLVTIGLTILFPRKWHKAHNHVHYSRPENRNHQTHTEFEKFDNNPSVSVNFGFLSRHLHADSLETVQLSSNFGELEVFFDHVELSPKGAEVVINCSFGAIKLYIPKQWRIIDRLTCALGAVELDTRFAAPAEDGPQLTLIGSVSLGEIKVRYI
jgi:predicted membrane protein